MAKNCKPWVVWRQFGDVRAIAGQYRRWNDAQNIVRRLRRLSPQARFWLEYSPDVGMS